MTELQSDWLEWRYDGRGYYLLQDPEITFDDDVSADVYCDEHNRALAGEKVIEERAKVAAFFRKHNREQYAKAIENGEHDQ